MRTILLLILFVSSFLSLSGQTTIDTTEVSGVWTVAKSPYVISQHVSVESEKRLIIQAGVEIRFRGGSLTVRGGSDIIAEGTESAPIKFTSDFEQPKPGDWRGLELYASDRNSVLRYCQIEYANIGLRLYAGASGCSASTNYTPVEHCIIRWNSNDGVYIHASGSSYFGCSIPQTGNCSPELRYNEIYENGGNGIRVVASTGYQSRGYVGATIERNLILANGNDGIACSGSYFCEPKIRNNTVLRNTSAGISYQDNFEPKDFLIQNNILTENGIGILAERDSIGGGGYNDVWQNQIDYLGNASKPTDISQDPAFEDPASNNFTLRCTSPCIDAGDPETSPDPDSTRPDLGAFFTNRTFRSDFSADTKQGYPPFSVQFTASPTFGEIPINEYFWEFGDGTTSTKINPKHFYRKPGVYDVSLRITNPGCRLDHQKVASELIRAVNDPPALVEPLPPITMEEDRSNQELQLSALFTDEQKATLTFEVTGGTHVMATVSGDFISLTPFPENWFGKDTISVAATDEWGATTSQVLGVTVFPVNDPPVLTGFSPPDQSISLDSIARVSFSVDAFDVDSELKYRWKVNGEEQGTESNAFEYSFENSGIFTIEAFISDEEKTLTVAWEAEVQITTTAINRPPWLQDIRVYPNPFKDYLHIDLDLSRPATFEMRLVDVSGKTVHLWKQQSFAPGAIRVNWETNEEGWSLPSGVYYLCLNGKNGGWRMPILLVR